MSQHFLFVGGEDHDLRMPFLESFRDRGFKVTAAGTGSAAPFERAGIDFARFEFERFINPASDRRALTSIRDMILRVKPDLVQTFDTKLNFLVPIAMRGKGPPIIRTINGRGWLYSSRSPAAMALRPVYRGLHRVASRWARATTFEHGEDKAFFDKNHMAGSGGSLVIPGAGLDVKGFEESIRSGPDADYYRRELGLEGCRVVMTVTRMTRQKGIGTLLEAAARVHSLRPDIRFVLVGPRESEGPLAISQEEIDAHKPYVIFTGPRTDVPSLLKAADVFAFPTEYREGIPRALMEAAIAHVPIVSTDMPGCCEVVKDGWSGYLVPPFSPDLMAEKIITVLDNPEVARAMAMRAAEPVRQHLSLDAIVSRYIRLYRAALESPPDLRLDPSMWRMQTDVMRPLKGD